LSDVKWIINRLEVFLSRFHVLRPSEAPSEVSSPVGIALIACIVCSVLIFWAAGPVVVSLHVWWAELLVYALIPILVTFIILYRSDWHQEITGAARTSLLLLLSCIIFCCALIAMGVMLILGCVLTLGFKADMSPQ
jgi:hypothetical protein